MTATNDAPDPHATGPDRWQPILNGIADLQSRVRSLGNDVNATLDAHLARLETLRHQLAHPAWITAVKAPGNEPGAGPQPPPGAARYPHRGSADPTGPDATWMISSKG
ncbi:hypothetical protein PUR71_12945 [Streptomyces sp. SP17BM10]|uniref:hypothetical protein n=1 Tax=Streptomyces sp. SP17BM10 TaxID=3002530 RepID=UPI002E7A7336|nr:hypothetical protein [Streptomyces sp. SP17BM10]MEE1783807.1 hypothetical protein [Streptomyces sp. SP17BM10]